MAAVLLYVSIAEAALRIHAEVRGYDLPKNEKHRTFGKVLEAWESAGKAEAVAIWEDLIKLRDHRNLAHLFKAAEEKHDWREALGVEEDLLRSGERVLAVLRGLPPTKRAGEGGGGRS